MSITAIPLIRAAAGGDAGAVRRLLASGAAVDVRTPTGDTALIRAALSGHAEVVRVLLAAGADARARDGLGLTAYDWSVLKGFQGVARLLREHSPEGERGDGAAEHGAKDSPAGPVLKRCPKCDGVYRGEILAYCPRDAERLVSADALPEAEPERAEGARPWVWALVALTLIGGLYVGYRINRYGFEGTPTRAYPGRPATQQKRPVTGGALKGKEVSLPDPQYTAEGEVATGEVTVEVKVDKQGEVVWARAASGPPTLQSAAVKAALGSKFASAIPARGAATASGTITYSFE